jgi:membrane-associated phospholipid phosphatase
MPHSMKAVPPWVPGVVLGVTAWAGFGWIAQAALADGAPTPLDQAVADWFYAHRMAGLTTGMRLVTELGSTAGVTGISVVIACGMVWKRAWHRLIVFGLFVPGGTAMNALLKLVFHRPRPRAEEALVIATGYSFPSGHTMAATVLYGGLVCLAWRGIADGRGRTGAALGAFVLVALVGLSRMLLGVHYLSDVLGAFVFGVGWLAFCLTATGRWRQRGGFTNGNEANQERLKL